MRQCYNLKKNTVVILLPSEERSGACMCDLLFFFSFVKLNSVSVQEVGGYVFFFNNV